MAIIVVFLIGAIGAALEDAKPAKGAITTAPKINNVESKKADKPAKEYKFFNLFLKTEDNEMNDNIKFLSFPMYKSRMSLFESLPTVENAVVFVGDSITQRNQWHEFFPGLTVLNRGIDSDRSLGVLKRLDHIISLKPSKIFLMIGINDINDGRDIDHILGNYESIILRIQSELPHTKLYIQSVLPVNNSVYNHKINNDHVKNVNSRLADLTAKHDVTFINIYPHVLKDNEFDEKYTVDGCHLSGEGYLAWVNLIRDYVVE